MANITTKGYKEFAAGFTGEEKRIALKYDFAQDGGAYSGNTYILGKTSGKVLIKEVIVRATTAVTSLGSATVSVGQASTANTFADAVAKTALAADLVAANPATNIPMVLADATNITMTIGTADLTAGVVIVEVIYKDASAA
jgi:hypothetical protein